MPAPTSISSSRSALANCWRAWPHSSQLSRMRRETEGALRYRGEQFQTLLNQAPLGVYVVDADFRIREMNPVALPVFGDIPGGVIGRDFDEVIHILWDKDFADELVAHLPTHPGDRRTVRHSRARRAAPGSRGHRVLRMAIGSHHAAGRTFWVGLLLSRYLRAEERGRGESVSCGHRRFRGRRHHFEGPQRRHSVGQRLGRTHVRLYARRTGRATGATC